MRALVRRVTTGLDAYLLLARGGGTPVAKATWEHQYRQGFWDSLFSADELAHYMVIAGFAHHWHASPSILDVGCGHGVLLKPQHALGFSSYLGLDLSTVAIERARGLAVRNAQFVSANFEEWTPSGRFDVVVFNESLYYASRPLEVLGRYADALAEGGVLIVSMYRQWHHRLLWRALLRQFACLNEATVRNGRGETWDIRVLRPRSVDARRVPARAGESWR
jgi:2-polyprenyl-3-methyl-5-hydroxy-6-metoxy-1,4-benzoquinol methylase